MASGVQLGTIEGQLGLPVRPGQDGARQVLRLLHRHHAAAAFHGQVNGVPVHPLAVVGGDLRLGGAAGHGAVHRLGCLQLTLGTAPTAGAAGQQEGARCGQQ